MLRHQHFGKLTPHRHTSYPALVFLLLVATALVVGTSWSASAAEPAVNPQAGSVGLTGTVKGPAPTSAAIILAPANGSSTTSTPITVSGTCPAGTFVEITKNDTFAGVTTCQDDETFSLLIDLFEGANTLVARVSDSLGQYGPDSRSIIITYNGPATGSAGSGVIGRQLFLDMTTTVLAGNPNENISRTVTIVGGVGPYAVSWDFGDDSTTLMSVPGEGPVTARHTYTRAGTYRVIVRATDSLGNTAFLQFITIVNGPAEPIGANGGRGAGALPGKLTAVGPVLGFAGVMVMAFWIGERRGIAKIRRQRHVAA